MRMRWTAYAGVSTTLAAGVIVKALAQRPNFYSAAVYLAQSSANLMILTNLMFMLACGSLLLLQKILYGPLRAIEVEQLYEKAWFAVTETCLAMTIFRGEIGATFIIMFFALLAGKVWGWIGEGRLEILEQQPPANPRLFHTRLMISLLLSVTFDMTMLDYIVKEVVGMARPDMMVMFGFEFAVLSILSLSTLARYAISLMEILIVRKQKEKRIEEIRKERQDARDERDRAMAEQVALPVTDETGTLTTETTVPGPAGLTSTTVLPAPLGRGPDDPVDDTDIEVEGWEEKGRWVFYLDLTTDFFKLVIYLSFFFILLVFYGLPIHIMRDVFLTCRSFFKRIADFIRYRTATRDMNERYPDATPEEIGTEDVCIICREEMRPIPAPNVAPGAAPLPTNPVIERMRPKKLPCGHILHFSCLRSWLERQQICPTCRRPVVPTPGQPARGGGPNAVAGQVAPGQNGANPGQPAQPHGQGADGQNRARVFQLGPLRIGVGAGRGMFEDLVQQIHNGEAPPAQDGNQNGQQQYGFGFGIGRGNRRTRDQSPIQSSIDRAERHIAREVNNLRLASNELATVRLLQGELERLRGLRNGGTAQMTPTNSGNANQQPLTIPGPRQTSAFVANAQQNVLAAGSSELPQGLTLPEGWTMIPLHRLGEPHLPPQVPAPTAPIPTNSTNSAPVSGQQVPVQSMFADMPAGWRVTPTPAEAPRQQPAANESHPALAGRFSETPGILRAPLNPSTTGATNGSTTGGEEPISSFRSTLNTLPGAPSRPLQTTPPPEFQAAMAELRAQLPHNGGPPSMTAGDATHPPAAPAREESTQDRPVVDDNSVSTPPWVTNPTLPSWGTPAPSLFRDLPPREFDGRAPVSSQTAKASSDQNGVEASTSNGNSSTTGDTALDGKSADTEGASNPESEGKSKPKPASVEDSIEGPD